MEIRHFHGITPRVPAQNLQFHHAVEALDVDLRHGTLKPWRTDKVVAQATSQAKTMYQHDCCWFTFDKCVDIAPWTVSCKRLYVSGNAPYLEVYPLADGQCQLPAPMRVGVPAPSTAVSVRALPAKTPTNTNYLPDAQERESRSYVYTYINTFGEEGPPSYPSPNVDVDDGSPVTLTGFSRPPKEYGVTHIKIYRRVTGFRSETQVQQGLVSAQTDFFHVATIPVTQATHIDTGLNVDTLGQALTTLDVLEPPEHLQGVSQIPNTRMLVGFTGNLLAFSMNNQPWNWPLSQRYALDDNIVAIEVWQDKVFVMTDGHPYTVSIGDGVDERACRQILRHATPLPMITCGSQGAISTPFGVFYVSDRGLAMLGSGEPVMATSPWFAVDDWRKLQPHNMRLGWHDGAVFMTSSQASYILQLDDAHYGQVEYHRLSRLSVSPMEYFTGRNGELFYRLADAIYQWQAGDAYRPYYWKSAVVDSKQYSTLGAIRLWGSGVVDMQIFAEDRDIFEKIPIPPNRAVRLPRYGHHLHHQVAFSGVHEVVSVEMAYSRWELSTA